MTFMRNVTDMWWKAEGWANFPKSSKCEIPFQTLIMDLFNISKHISSSVCFMLSNDCQCSMTAHVGRLALLWYCDVRILVIMRTSCHLHTLKCEDFGLIVRTKDPPLSCGCRSLWRCEVCNIPLVTTGQFAYTLSQLLLLHEMCSWYVCVTCRLRTHSRN